MGACRRRGRQRDFVGVAHALCWASAWTLATFRNIRLSRASRESRLALYSCLPNHT